MEPTPEKIVDRLRLLPGVSWMFRGFSQIPEDADSFQRFQSTDKTGYVAGHVDVWKDGHMQVITFNRTASFADAISALSSPDDGSVTLDWVRTISSITTKKRFTAGEFDVWPVSANGMFTPFIAVFDESGLISKAFIEVDSYFEVHLRTPKNQVEFFQLLKVMDFDISA